MPHIDNPKISLHSIIGAFNPKTMRVTSIVRKCVLLVFIDSSNIHNFLDLGYWTRLDYLALTKKKLWARASFSSTKMYILSLKAFPHIDLMITPLCFILEPKKNSVWPYRYIFVIPKWWSWKDCKRTISIWSNTTELKPIFITCPLSKEGIWLLKIMCGLQGPQLNYSER